MNHRFQAIHIGTTPAEPLPISRALIASFWTIVALLTIWSLPGFASEGGQITPEYQRAGALFLSLLAVLTAAPALALRSDLRRTEVRRRELLDPLTRLPGWQLLRLDLGKALTKATRRQSLVGIITFDFGGLTAVAERLGTTARDQLLVDIGRRLRRSIGSKDIVARSAAEEFTIVRAANPSADDVAWTAERALEELDAPFQIGREEVLLTATGGIGISVAAGCSPDLLLRAASLALARAKETGPSRYRVLYADMVDPAE